MKTALKFISILLALPILAALAISGRLVLGEGFNIFYPDADTEYAPSFNQKKFGQIQVGMDTTAVFQLVGKPFGDRYHWFDPYAKGYVWYYTNDGACKCHDFAWLNKYVVIGKNGKVVMKGETVSYD